MTDSTDFQIRQLRQAASALLEALERAIHELELWLIGNIRDEATETAIRIGKAAIGQAKAAGIHAEADASDEMEEA